MKRRAERQDETRRRIVEAAIVLHGSVGMNKTTVKQIAELAGVGRQTVYRHFADELALGRACSGLYFERNPLPDPESWKKVADPEDRARVALRESYAFHRKTETMIGLAIADVGESPIMEPYFEHWRRAADIVASAWGNHGDEREGALSKAAIGHALAFQTWRNLVRDQGLTDDQAVELMLRFVAATRNPRKTRTGG
ncbi:MAG: TetR/AcrR family transcriptional regulator [Acidobacteriota bacterium]|nr:TetR/AcrR family transcriptional regulator [Acidobacteriota bacterium]